MDIFNWSDYLFQHFQFYEVSFFFDKKDECKTFVIENDTRLYRVLSPFFHGQENGILANNTAV